MTVSGRGQPQIYHYINIYIYCFILFLHVSTVFVSAILYCFVF